MRVTPNSLPCSGTRAQPVLSTSSHERHLLNSSSSSKSFRHFVKHLHREQYRERCTMNQTKRYVLRLFMSLKYITANVVDRNNGRVVVSASSVEHALKDALECGRSCNAKAAAAVGEVLAMRLKVEGIGQRSDGGRAIHANVQKEIEKKGFKNRTKVWAIINALKSNGVNLIIDDTDSDRPH
ncbi:uncharacterized protein LOC131231418 [Magnolia sinica]|uniref:uncharacterized protein LOC131231418 n=1 Tax=Magnolia sinica TaxID=86752 RepID=UPI0026597C38|nr:uncharacterized protein LOC131231418 [Magnolia sinica]